MIKKTEPMLSAFIDYTTIRKANLFGENIVNLTESSYLAYEETYSLMKVLYELIEKTLVEHKTLSSKITNV